MTVAEQARKLANELLTSYRCRMAPAQLRNTKLGAKLFHAQCSACHSATGHSDGPIAASLSPPPIVSADHGRAQEGSVFAIQKKLTHCVDGTSMPSFAKLSEQEGWAIAYSPPLWLIRMRSAKLVRSSGRIRHRPRRSPISTEGGDFNGVLRRRSPLCSVNRTRKLAHVARNLCKRADVGRRGLKQAYHCAAMTGKFFDRVRLNLLRIQRTQHIIPRAKFDL